MAYRPTARFSHHRFGNGELHRDMLDVACRRACPECLQRAGHHRRAWDVALVTCCPDHGSRLVSKCPGCGQGLRWTDASVVLCRCGSDVRTWPSIAVAEAERVANERLLALAEGLSQDWLPEPLRACAPPDLVRLAMSLGMFLSDWSRLRRPETLVRSGPDAVARITVAGIGALSGWPFPLLEFLASERARAAGRPGRFGARKTLGPFYDWMRDVEPAALRDVLLTVVRVSVGADPVTAHRMHRSELILRGRPFATGLVGLEQAAAMLGRSTETTKRLLAGVETQQERDTGRGLPAALSRAAVKALADKERGQLTLAEVAFRLGVAKSRTRRILGAGLIGDPQELTGGGSGRWAIDAIALESLLSALANAVIPRPGERLRGFDYAVEALRRRKIDLAAMLRRILDGRLHPAGLDKEAVGLKQLLFARSDVAAAAEVHTPDSYLTVQDVSRRLDLKWQVVSHLVRHGILAASSRGVPAAAVKAFSAEYVAGAEIARRRMTSPRALEASLAKTGVQPVSGPNVDGGRQNFYRRSAVT